MKKGIIALSVSVLFLAIALSGCVQRSYCGNDVCETMGVPPETPANCPADCGPAPECIKEGNTGIEGEDECCEGLGEISNCSGDETMCGCGPGFICTYCGNTECGLGENACNCPQDCKSSITVISPNGWEEWQIGGEYDIKWESTNVDNVNIYLVFPDGALCFLKTTPASEEHYLFPFLGGYQCPNIDRVPHSQPNNNYKIAIFGDPQNVSDYSDNYFLIVYASIQPSITVLSPNGGEQWQIGKTYDIIWNTTLYHPSGKVGLELCDTRGIPGVTPPGTNLCSEITTKTNSGSYSWLIPQQLVGMIVGGEDIYKIHARIWPEGLQRWAWHDLSDNNFSIVSDGS